MDAPSEQDITAETPVEAVVTDGIDAKDEVQATEHEDIDVLLKDIMKDKGDKFDDMVEHEERIRLGETGWKARYYQVHATSLSWAQELFPCLWHSRLSTVLTKKHTASKAIGNLSILSDVDLMPALVRPDSPHAASHHSDMDMQLQSATPD